jgi:ABC-type nitrate/sulfonate/bicarbonate transport system permease component
LGGPPTSLGEPANGSSRLRPVGSSLSTGANVGFQSDTQADVASQLVPATTAKPFTARRGASVILGMAGVLGIGAAMELISRLGVVSERDVPPPSEVLQSFLQLLGQVSFWTQVGHTMLAWAIGLALAGALGVVCGLVLGSNVYVWRAFRPTVEMLRPVPAVALLPLAVLLWGPTLGSEVFMIAFAAFWPMLVQTMYGLTQVDKVARETARSFRFTRVEELRHLIVPSALPFVATGLRISSAVALIVGITTEIIVGNPGLGRDITTAQSGGDTVRMYGLVFAIGVLGVIIHLVLSAPERYLLRWHTSRRGSA